MTRVGVLLFDGVDALDVVGPYEVLLTANRVAIRRGEPAPFEVVTLSPAAGPVVAYGGLELRGQSDSANPGHLDVVVIPGTIDVEGALADAELVATVERLGAGAATATSVCTGSFLLAAAGLLTDRTATTHHEDVAALAQRDDVANVVSGVRWVDDGDTVTAGGISSGIAFGLHLVDRYGGRDLATATANQIEHAWDPDGRDMVPIRSSTNPQ